MIEDCKVSMIYGFYETQVIILTNILCLYHLKQAYEDAIYTSGGLNVLSPFSHSNY